MKPCSGVERRAAHLREDVLRPHAPVVLAGKQNRRDQPIEAETILFLLHKGMKEPFLQDVSKIQEGKLF